MNERIKRREEVVGMDGQIDGEMKKGLRTGKEGSRGGWVRESRGGRNRGIMDGWREGGRKERKDKRCKGDTS